jgi:hypothetical protein
MSGRFQDDYGDPNTVTIGIRFVVIDRADVLDRAKRKELTSLLLSSEIEQAVVLATGEEPPPASMPVGVRFFDLPYATKSRDGARIGSCTAADHSAAEVIVVTDPACQET